jgi:histidinol-phosphate/aromatic aminotransferase/cobyric acid decarboxylase-like protein
MNQLLCALRSPSLGAFAAALLCAATTARAAEYTCAVTRKLDREREYPQQQIEQYQYSVRIEDGNTEFFVSRCSYTPSASNVTCDRYKIDHVVFDLNVKVKKYYVFNSQFDLQLFPDLTFVENNGRGGIAYGKCKVISP